MSAKTDINRSTGRITHGENTFTVEEVVEHLEVVPSYPIATKEQAEANETNEAYMTPLRVGQTLSKNIDSGETDLKNYFESLLI